MKSIAIIPARLGSTRLADKPLHKLAGREMVLRVMDAAQKAQVDKVVVATDSEKIAQCVTRAGGEAVITSPSCATGTDRVLEALRKQDGRYDVVFNIQGDEPLLHHHDIDSLLDLMRKTSGLNMATLARPLAAEDLDNLNNVKVILDHRNNAIYFSRFPIPFSRERDLELLREELVMSHVGIYAYRRDFLERFCEQGPLRFERAESLEQLRALWMGERIAVSKTDNYYRGVDTEEDARSVEEILSKGGDHG